MREFREEYLVEGDIVLFYTKKGFFGAAIRKLTRAIKSNHVGLYVVDFDYQSDADTVHVIKTGYILEALPAGFVKTPITNYIGNPDYEMKAVRFKPSAFKDMLEYDLGVATFVRRAREAVEARRLNGKNRYDWLAVGYLGIRYALKNTFNAIPFLRDRNFFNRRERIFCSEAMCIFSQGISSKVKKLFAGDKYPNATCGTITPKDCSKSQHVDYVCGYLED